MMTEIWIGVFGTGKIMKKLWIKDWHNPLRLY